MAGKILNINRGTPFRIQTGGTLSNKPASSAATSSASITLSPPTGSVNWGGMMGSRTIIPADCVLLSAVIRASWYSSNYGNYNSIHFTHAQYNSFPVEFVGGNWQFTTLSHKVIHRPFYNSYPDTSFQTAAVSISPGTATFSLLPYSNASNYNYFNPSYCILDTANWLIKYPVL
jgi:hypothetical protein